MLFLLKNILDMVGHLNKNRGSRCSEVSVIVRLNLANLG